MMNKLISLVSKILGFTSPALAKRVLVSIWYAYRKIWLGVFLFSSFLALMTVFSLDNNGYSHRVADWGDAKWIMLDEGDSPVTYFRYQFVLQNKPDSSFLKLSASDSYTVYVNGKRISAKKSPSMHPVSLSMPTEALKSGTNLIAIRVEKKTLGRTPELIALLSINDLYTGTKYHYSNEKWKVSAVPGNQFVNKFSWFDEIFDDSTWKAASVSDSDLMPSMPDNLPPEIVSDKALVDFTPIWHAVPEIGQARLKAFVPYKRDQMTDAWLMVKCNGEYRLAVNNIGVGNYYSKSSTIRVVNIFQYLTSSHINYIDMTAECGFGEGISLKAFIALNDNKIVSIPSAQWQLYPLVSSQRKNDDSLEDPYFVVGQTSPELERMRSMMGGVATLEIEDESNLFIFLLKLIKWIVFWGILFSAINALLLAKFNVDLTFVHEVNVVFVLASLIGYLCMYWLLDERIQSDRFFNLLNTTVFALMCISFELVLAYNRGYFKRLLKGRGQTEEGQDVS